MGEYLIKEATLAGIANAIREKVGCSDGIDPANMAEMIAGIQSGGGETAELFGYRAIKGSITPTKDISITDLSLELPLYELRGENTDPVYSYQIGFMLLREFCDQGGISGVLFEMDMPIAAGKQTGMQFTYSWSGFIGGANEATSRRSRKATVSSDYSSVTYTWTAESSTSLNNLCAGLTYNYLYTIMAD